MNSLSKFCPKQTFFATCGGVDSERGEPMIKGKNLRPKIDKAVTNVCVVSPLISDLPARTIHEEATSDLWKHAKCSFTNDRALDSILVR